MRPDRPCRAAERVGQPISRTARAPVPQRGSTSSSRYVRRPPGSRRHSVACSRQDHDLLGPLQLVQEGENARGRAGLVEQSHARIHGTLEVRGEIHHVEIAAGLMHFAGSLPLSVRVHHCGKAPRRSWDRCCLRLRASAQPPAVTLGKRPAAAIAYIPPMPSPSATSTLPFQSGRCERYLAAR